MEARPSSSLARWLPWLLALLGAAALLYAVLPNGIGVTSDCVDYFSTSASLLRGEGFWQHDGRPYASWPPLYPLLLALGSWTGLRPETTALVINALALALTLWVTAWWALRRLSSRWMALWLSLAMLLHFAIWDVALHAWTEPLYNLMALVFLMKIPSAAGGGRWRAILLMGLLAAAAWLLRYVGVTLVVTGGLFILFGSHLAPFRRIKRAAAFGALASAPALLWMLRNQMLMGQMAGERSPSDFGLPQNLARVAKIAWWMVPESWGKWLPAGLLALLVVLLVWHSYRGRSQRVQRYRGLRSAMLIYSALYLIVLVYTSTRYAFEPIHSRYLMPVLPPLLVWLALWMDERFDRLPIRSLQWVLGGLLMLWLVFPAAVSTRMLHEARTHGIDVFGAPEWRGWALWDWLHGSPREAVLISNGADAVHYFTGLPVRLAPRRWIHSSSRTPTSELEDFASIFEEDRPVLYVWINEFPRTGARVNYHDLEELLERYRLEPIASFPEGSVWMVLPRATKG